MYKTGKLVEIIDNKSTIVYERKANNFSNTQDNFWKEFSVKVYNDKDSTEIGESSRRHRSESEYQSPNYTEYLSYGVDHNTKCDGGPRKDFNPREYSGTFWYNNVEEVAGGQDQGDVNDGNNPDDGNNDNHGDDNQNNDNNGDNNDDNDDDDDEEDDDEDDDEYDDLDPMFDNSDEDDDGMGGLLLSSDYDVYFHQLASLLE